MQENYYSNNTMDVKSQLECLQIAYNMATELVPYRLKLNEINKELGFLNKKIKVIRNGLPTHIFIIVGVLIFFIIEFIINPIFAIILTVVYFCWYSSFFASDNLSKREELAQKVFNKNGPVLLQEQESLNKQIENILNSTQYANVCGVIPNEFLEPQKIQALINIINTRSASDINGAIEVYNRTK